MIWVLAAVVGVVGLAICGVYRSAQARREDLQHTIRNQHIEIEALKRRVEHLELMSSASEASADQLRVDLMEIEALLQQRQLVSG